MSNQHPMSVQQILQRNGDRYMSYLAAKELAAYIKRAYPDLQQDPEIAKLVDLIENP